MAALGGNWKGLDETVLLGITWQQLGWFNILLVTAGLAYFCLLYTSPVAAGEAPAAPAAKTPGSEVDLDIMVDE